MNAVVLTLSHRTTTGKKEWIPIVGCFQIFTLHPFSKPMMVKMLELLSNLLPEAVSRIRIIELETPG
jgi:hypothetical protein